MSNFVDGNTRSWACCLMGVSKNKVYPQMTILNYFNGEYDHNPMDLGVHYFQTNPNGVAKLDQNGFMILILNVDTFCSTHHDKPMCDKFDEIISYHIISHCHIISDSHF